jgi:lipid-binding SYLF domain-containing protein
MNRFLSPVVASLVLLNLAAAPHRPTSRELKTVESAAEVVHAFSVLPLRGIPRSMLHDAAGVAVIPHVIKAGLVLSERFGRGVVLMHEPSGRWSNPVFVTLSGGGIGGQVGIESTDLVLVFKSQKSLDRALHGKLTLGGDVTVAAGPLGRDAEVAADRRLKAEIFSWSRSRGLFAGVSVEGGRLQVDHHANEAFYAMRGCQPPQILALQKVPMAAAVEGLKEQLDRLSPPPPPPSGVIVPSQSLSPRRR